MNKIYLLLYCLFLYSCIGFNQFDIDKCQLIDTSSVSDKIRDIEPRNINYSYSDSFSQEVNCYLRYGDIDSIYFNDVIFLMLKIANYEKGESKNPINLKNLEWRVGHSPIVYAFERIGGNISGEVLTSGEVVPYLKQKKNSYKVDSTNNVLFNQWKKLTWKF